MASIATGTMLDTFKYKWLAADPSNFVTVCFKIFDLDSDGVLNKKELIDMVGILCTVANESLKNQSSRASTPSDSNDSDSTEKGFDPEVILVNLRDKLVTVPKNGRKPIFQLGPNGDNHDEKDREIVTLKEVSNISVLFAFKVLNSLRITFVLQHDQK